MKKAWLIILLAGAVTGVKCAKAPVNPGLLVQKVCAQVKPLSLVFEAARVLGKVFAQELRGRFSSEACSLWNCYADGGARFMENELPLAKGAPDRVVVITVMRNIWQAVHENLGPVIKRDTAASSEECALFLNSYIEVQNTPRVIQAMKAFGAAGAQECNATLSSVEREQLKMYCEKILQEVPSSTTEPYIIFFKGFIPAIKEVIANLH